jgi:N-acetylglucosamine-6-phosphate deacetylase
MRLLLRCLGAERVVLVTDAMAAAGLPDGEYDLVGNRVTVRGGRATLPDGTIASSTAGMHDCVRNVVQLLDVPLHTATQMASGVPARAMGVSDRIGSLAVGQPANLVIFDDQVAIAMTIVSGQVVYRTD